MKKSIKVSLKKESRLILYIVSFFPLILEFTFDPVILRIELWFFFNILLLIQNLFIQWMYLLEWKYPVDFPFNKIPNSHTNYSIYLLSSEVVGKIDPPTHKKKSNKNTQQQIEWQSKDRLTKQNADIE